jgi:copper(I)-binding protein
MVMDAYARVASKVAKSGAAFMMIHNHSDQDDRLIAAASDVAKRVELHTHIEEDGVMKMTKLDDGMIIPAGGMHALKRGGDHVMFMGLTRSLEHGDVFELTLTFEHAGDVTLTVPVDLERQDKMTGTQAFALITERHCVPPLVLDTVFDPNHLKTQKHTFAHTNLRDMQLIVFI